MLGPKGCTRAEQRLFFSFLMLLNKSVAMLWVLIWGGSETSEAAASVRALLHWGALLRPEVRSPHLAPPDSDLTLGMGFSN